MYSYLRITGGIKSPIMWSPFPSPSFFFSAQPYLNTPIIYASGAETTDSFLFFLDTQPNYFLISPFWISEDVLLSSWPRNVDKNDE